MELPAQAVRFVLDGVYATAAKRSSSWNKSSHGKTWPKEVTEILRSYHEKKAIAFVERLLPGDVGKGFGKELSAYVVM